MTNFLRAFLWFLVLAFIAYLFHYFVGEKICGVCPGDFKDTRQEQLTKQPITPIAQKRAELLILDAEGKTVFKFPSNFSINPSDGAVTIPESLVGFKDSIFNFLNKNQGKELLITAKFLKTEGETRGMDRANFLKNILVNESGINPNRIIPQAVLSDFSFDSNNKYTDGIAMLFKNASIETQKVLDKSISNKTLYSAFASVEFKPDRSLQTYAFELKNYLKKYPDKKVSITGHTDAVGNEASNYKFGLKRANNVRGYLVSQGINKNKLKAYSKGEKEPIASNTTEEGKAKNRRITIEVK